MTHKTISVPDEIAGLPIIASVSGGKDSTALILALREAEIPFRAVFADTGWEAVETYAYLDYLRERLSLTIDVVGKPGGMRVASLQMGNFPGPLTRWCTRELKIVPLRAYHDAAGDDTVSAMGIRGDESESRSRMSELEDEPAGSRSWGGWIWRPLLRWTIGDVLAIHARAGVALHPHYRAGFDRVGCYPCIFANKSEIALLASTDPARVDAIRGLEEEVTSARELAMAAHVPTAKKPVKYKQPVATFFQGKGGQYTPIDRVVAWSRTSRGGRQLPLLAEPPKGGCMRWGLCDTPTKEDDK